MSITAEILKLQDLPLDPSLLPLFITYRTERVREPTFTILSLRR